ncbi:MAG: glycosidase [Cyanobacteria bacterium RYN_339]|nr:glycosidase [Cyanobacteria bacterium RYN_339]
MTDPRPFQLTRAGVLLAPAPGFRREAGGVLNPTVYQVHGRTLMMYRAVDSIPENFSRLALAELRWEGDRLVATRLDSLALEPSEPYELLSPGPGGGCEDPRVTAIGDELYLCYTGYGGDNAPRIALARSRDGIRWERMGLARFTMHVAVGQAIDFNQVDNKDAMLFPQLIGGRYAMLHRPMFRGEIKEQYQPRQSIWISFSKDMIHWEDHQVVAEPEAQWECLKLGGGTQPVWTPEGWLMVYHGVEGERDSDPNRRYSAGAMVLDLEAPWRVVYRSPEPILTPDAAEEREGVVNNVVFPTGLWRGEDGKFLVAYGMADWCIGWARMN